MLNRYNYAENAFILPPVPFVNKMASDGTTVDHSSEFDPEWYMNSYYEYNSLSGETDENKLLQFNLAKYYETFQSGDVKGSTLLDVGTGPSVHSIISACRHVDDIYLTDFAAQNRKVLADWWKSDKMIIKNITEYVLRKENSSQTVAERQTMMKEKVRVVLPIDVNLSKPLGSGCDVTLFDIITSSLCLEVASLTLDQYRTNTANVPSLLKSGGHLIMNGILEESWYLVGEAKFSCVKLTEDYIQSTFVGCGFNIQRFETVKFESTDTKYSNFRGYFFMHAIKQ